MIVVSDETLPSTTLPDSPVAVSGGLSDAFACVFKLMMRVFTGHQDTALYGEISRSHLHSQ